MSEHHTITIELAEDLLLAIGRAARAAGATASDYVRASLAGAVARGQPDTASALEPVFASATGWFDLQIKLRAEGYVLRRDPQGRLNLHSWPLDRPLLPLAEIGQSHVALTLRFRAPFPGLAPSNRALRAADQGPRIRVAAE